MNAAATESEALTSGVNRSMIILGMLSPKTGVTSHQKTMAKKLGISAVNALATMGGTPSGILIVTLWFTKKR